jgi:hypothetical protein
MKNLDKYFLRNPRIEIRHFLKLAAALLRLAPTMSERRIRDHLQISQRSLRDR